MRVLINGEPHELEPGATLALAVVELGGAPEGRGWAGTALVEGARIELVAAAQGG
jgi:sulfur carrier protein ThiS